MKLIDVPVLTDLNMLFNSASCDGVELRLRLELYSCKATAATRNLARSFDDERQLVKAAAALDSDTALALNRKTLLFLLDTLNEALPDFDFSHTKVDQFQLLPSAAHVRAQIDAQLASCVPAYAAAYAERLWAAVAAELDALDELEIYTYVGDDPFAAADDADHSDADDERSGSSLLSSSFDAGAGAADELCFFDRSSSPPRTRRRRRSSLLTQTAAAAGSSPLWSFNYFFFDRKRKRVLLWYAFVRSVFVSPTAAAMADVEFEME
jgi:hypothetical protein